MGGALPSLFTFLPTYLGRDSSVGIATHYGLDGPGIESRWGARFFRTCPDQQWAPGFPRGYSGRGVAMATHHHLAPRLRRSIPLLPLWAFVAYYRVTFTLTRWRLYTVDAHRPSRKKKHALSLPESDDSWVVRLLPSHYTY